MIHYKKKKKWEGVRNGDRWAEDQKKYGKGNE